MAKPTLVLMPALTLSLVAAGASAANVQPYGDLYLFLGGNYARTYTAGQSEVDDFDLEYAINRHSNLGFSFRWDQYGGVFELGMHDIGNNQRGIWLRKAYGEYETFLFGDDDVIALLIGQNWSPFVNFSHEMANYARSEGFGAVYQDPTIQLKLSYLGAHIAILKPFVPVHRYAREQQVVTPTSRGAPIQEVELVGVDREITTGLPLDKVRSYVPAVAVGYSHEAKTWNVNVGGAFNTYAIEDTDQVQFTKKWIYAYLVYANSNVRLGDFTLGVSAAFIVNPANFGIFTESTGNVTYAAGAASALENIETGKFAIKDTWNVQGYLEVGYHIADDSVIHAGYGYSNVTYPNPGTEADLAMQGYLNWTVKLGQYVALIPSFAYRELMDDMAGNAEGRNFYAGILANVSFH